MSAASPPAEPLDPRGRLTPYQRVVITAYLERRRVAAERALAHYTAGDPRSWTEGTIRSQQHWVGVLATLRWLMPPQKGD